MQKKLEKITFILTLYKDNTYTERFLDYFSKLKISSELLIGDGGGGTRVKKILMKYTGINYKYFEFEDLCVDDYFKKLDFLIEKVKTPYLILCDNDDFFLLEGIEKSISFLDDNEDYVACGGTPLFFIAKKTKLYPFEWRVPNKSSLSVSQENALDRVIYYMGNYDLACWYHVLRRQDISIIIKKFINTQIKDLYLMELFIAYCLAIHGKIHWHARHIHYLRQLNSSQCNIHIKSFPHRVVFNNLGNEISVFLETLNLIITSDRRLEKETASENLFNLRILMAQYLEKIFLKKYVLGEFVTSGIDE